MGSALRQLLCTSFVAASLAMAAAAQQPAPGPPPDAQHPQPGALTSQAAPAQQTTLSDLLSAGRMERLSDTHWRFTGQAEFQRQGVQFFADEMDFYTDTNRLEARGNVVYATADGRIAAERIDFDTKNQLGTFFDASGIMSLGQKADRTQFGGQEPDVYFYGEKLEKLGQKKYRITRGGFTTCVQPTPRWELTSGSMVLNLDDYALLRNSVLHVKGVPLFYLPFVYYPIQEDDRATGFLLPTYGASTLRGSAISNAFFWAINRSQDATFFHDWFTRTGQGAGTEYRYIAGAGSAGSFRTYWFNQNQSTFESSGETTALPSKRSFNLTGSATQMLPRGLRGRVRLDYFSDVTTQQLYNQNLYYASQRVRTLGGALSGNWGPYSLTTVYQRNESFQNEIDSVVYGNAPRITGVVSPQRLFGLPIYLGGTGEYAFMLSQHHGSEPSDFSMGRTDLMPTVRVPFSKWTFLTINSSAVFRTTYYTESRDDIGNQIDQPLTRTYGSFRSDIIGPVFTKIWNTPNSSWAERYKHVIEPTFGVEQVTDIDNYRNVVVLTETSDFIVGGLRRLNYGLMNRFLARTRGTAEAPGQAREFLSIGLHQSYYSNAEASQYDVTYASAFPGRKLTSVSPVALIVRAAPTRRTDSTLRLEYDVTGLGLQTVSLSTGAFFGSHSVSANWSRRRHDPTRDADNYLNANSSFRFKQGRSGGTYSVSWDVTRSTIVSNTLMAFYNAQCCGFNVEYQRFNYPQNSSLFPIPSDRRINFSFTLAGLGTFSNFFGAFGGGQVR
jgi:LPS-assembly protein